MQKNKKKEQKELTLVALQEDRVTINQNIVFFNIGITREESIYMRLIGNEESNYEGILSILELESNILGVNNNIKNIYDLILAKINYNQYHFSYNEDKSQIFFCYSNWNRNTGK